jgi:AraC-like DNA-binding protein
MNSNPPGARVPMRYFLPLLDWLRSEGADVDQMLVMARLDRAVLEVREATLLPTQFDAFVASARRLTGRTDLGFQAGRRVQQTMHEILGFGMLSCRNLDEVMRLVARHYHLMTETFRLRWRRIGAGAGEALYTPTIAMPLQTLQFYMEMHASGHENQVRLFMGGDLPPYEVTLAMAEPPHVARYHALAPVQFRFDPAAMPGVRVVMGSEMLDRALPLGNPRMVAEIDERCRTLGQRPPAGDEGWGDYVRMVLRQTQGELITLEEVARHAQVSVRSVDRYLRKEGLQFRDLAQQVRFERACERLSQPSATVAQVAAELGFSDAANFSRAFRRVIGVAPGEFQRRAIGGPASPLD